MSESPLQQLDEIASTAKRITLQSNFDGPEGVTIQATFYRDDYTPGVATYNGHIAVRNSKQNPSVTLLSPCTSLCDWFARVAKEYPTATLTDNGVQCWLRGASTTTPKFRQLTIQAWAEAFNQPVPTDEDFAKQRKAERAVKQATKAGWIETLQAGQEGVKKWNREIVKAGGQLNIKAGNFVAVDLTGVKLGYRADCDGANFANAILRDAACISGRFKGCDFSGADLTNASMNSANVLGAKFDGANLTGVSFNSADVRSVDFRKAILATNNFEQIKFDEATQFPRGFHIPETAQWKGVGVDPRVAPKKSRGKPKPPPTDFAGFLDNLKKVTDVGKLDKALTMLKKDRFRLFAKVTNEHVAGIVKSQSEPDLVYSCRIAADGKYACCTQNLNVCGGLRGSPCKHLLVLTLGLVQAGELEPAIAHDWTQKAGTMKATLDKDTMTETLLEYKGAEAGEIDWRPTETLPEDFYAM